MTTVRLFTSIRVVKRVVFKRVTSKTGLFRSLDKLWRRFVTLDQQLIKFDEINYDSVWQLLSMRERHVHSKPLKVTNFKLVENRLKQKF